MTFWATQAARPNYFGDPLSDLLSGVEQASGAIASGGVQSIIIQSAAFPPIELDNPLAGVIPSSGSGDGSGSGGAPSAPSLLLQILRPQVTVNTSLGQFVLAPAGPAPAVPYVLFALLGVVALAAYGAGVLLSGPGEIVVE